MQHARTGGGTVAGGCSTTCARLNDGAEPLGSFGAVVGATIGETGEDLDINGPFLAPGFGAQGGTAADLRRIFGAAPAAVLPSSSRELLQARAGRGRAARRRAPARQRRPCRAGRDEAARPGAGGLVSSLATGCSSDPQADYCEAVKEHQVELTEIAAVRRTPGAVRRPAGLRRPGRARRPTTSPTSGEQVVGALRGLEQALDEAGVDPRRTTRSSRPPTSTEDERGGHRGRGRARSAPSETQ